MKVLSLYLAMREKLVSDLPLNWNELENWMSH